MLRIISGLAIFAVVITIGWVLGRTGALPPRSDRVLTRLAFFAATPALMLTTLAGADLDAVVSARALAAIIAELLTIAGAWAVHRWVLGRNPADALIGALASGYVNAANLGIPVALLVVGDVTPIAPILLLQLIVLTPGSFAILDVITGKSGRTALRRATAPLRNPLLIGVVTGTVLNLAGWEPAGIAGGSPAEVLGMLGRMAVPLMMLSLGLSLADSQRERRMGPLGRVTGPAGPALWCAVGWKLLVAPLLALAVGGLMGLRGQVLLVPVTTACLPTAQNIFMYASRYERATDLARDTVLLTTAGFAPVVLLAASILG
ncbi:AEC family transporter [Actinomyces gaoshouyii]|uniref:Membrane protein n=1 Tax=Actinomyces gaoshouyii TaxID=1960083 RepID=A0A8H9LIA7_9ACTO|nr:AEC family transporter [Actinomyces gaoshouyii]ARD42330.1 transporter [Actinomyces gaoshouyii]GGO95790.1 membrane protein [Actinomyces gaoshouyii]